MNSEQALSDVPSSVRPTVKIILIEESDRGFEVYGMPDDENRLECVPKADHDEALKTLAIQSYRRKELAVALIDEKTRTSALESELKASQEVADHRLGAMTLLGKVNDWFWPPETDVPEEAALLVEIHRFLEGCDCPPSVPQHLDTCRCSISTSAPEPK